MFFLKNYAPAFACLIICFLVYCKNGSPVKNEVIIHEPANPEMLNPVNFTDAESGYLISHLFQKLIDADFRKPDTIIPIIAESRPSIQKTQDGKMTLTFRIRKDAKWDNGSSITAKDVAFTLKTIKCPLVNNTNGRSYYEFINDFQFYNNDPHKFTIISNQVYFMAEAALTDVYILPEYFYDPKGLLQNFTAKQMSEESEQLKSEPKIKEFADDFNSEKRMRDPDFISGSGAYKFLEWKTNERITFTKKKNWWGEQFQQENCYFEAFPEKIFFQIIKDNTTAIVSLKAGNLDVMRSIKSKDFAELPKSEKFSLNFNAYTPLTYSYTYLGINTTSPCLNDKLTRQAIACLTDVDKMIQTIKYGQAHRVIGPVLPSKKKDYNTTIPNYNFDPEKAKELLAKAGWQNTNGDETLDKMINGKRTEFIIDFIINNESDDRKAIALLFQENAKKVGIKVNILSYDWAVFLEKSKDHRFDLMTGMWVGGPGPDDFKQIFHTRSEQEESANYYNFSNAEADSIITSVRTELNEGKRSALYKRFQEILHEEVPMVFLWTPTERIAVSKKFENAYPSDIRPGYWVQGFKMKAMN